MKYYSVYYSGVNLDCYSEGNDTEVIDDLLLIAQDHNITFFELKHAPKVCSPIENVMDLIETIDKRSTRLLEELYANNFLILFDDDGTYCYSFPPSLSHQEIDEIDTEFYLMCNCVDEDYNFCIEYSHQVCMSMCN